jgi:hypothetical protein
MQLKNFQSLKGRAETALSHFAGETLPGGRIPAPTVLERIQNLYISSLTLVLSQLLSNISPSTNPLGEGLE